MPSLLVVLEAGDRLPSGTVRGLLYRDLLFQNGFTPKFVTRQPVALLNWFDRLPPSVTRLRAVASLKNRLVGRQTRINETKILKQAKRADIVYLVKVEPSAFVCNLSRHCTARIIFDFVDAVWLQDWQQTEFHEVLKNVDAVTTDNEITADYARRFNGNCIVVPDSPQVEKFDEKRACLRNKPTDLITIGWIGSPGTAYNLYVVWEALEVIFEKYPQIHLRLVGTGRNMDLLPKFERVRFSCRMFYDQAGMVEEVLGMHIGIFPLQNVERCRGRGVLKATVYMSGETAVVASPVGESTTLIRHCENGMLAGSTGEWIGCLEKLITDRDFRQKLAQKGLDTIRNNFLIEHSFDKLKSVLLPEDQA
jgi:glycosyltransferase involved in cell wall biosynthesis